MRIHGLRFLGALALCLAALPRAARAQERPQRWAEDGAGSIFLQAAWGIQAASDTYVAPGFADHSQTSQSYAFGVGARGGYTFPFKLYLGGRAGYHFGRDGWEVWDARPGGGGSSQGGVLSYDIGDDGGTVTTTELSSYFGTEVGYDFVIGPVVIRPYETDGMLIHSAQQCFEHRCGRSTENHLFAGIGAAIFAVVGPFLIGVDSTFIAPLDDPDLNGGLFSLSVGLPIPR